MATTLAPRVPPAEVATETLQRWLVRATKTLFVITDHPTWQPQQQQLHFLGISRDTGAAREGNESVAGLEAKLQSVGANSGVRSLPCAAVLGCLTAHQESFLLLAAGAAVVAEFDGQRIFEVTRCEALPFSAEPSAEAVGALAGVRQLVERHFYFSYDMDITQRLQHRQHLEGATATTTSEGLMAAAGARFVWNRQLVAPLLCQGISTRWFVPVMQGFVQARELSGGALQLVLIARRSCRRAGTRYNARGLDDEGEVGNWVETEQIVRVNGKWLALAQVRGSAPVFWEQGSALTAVTVTRGSELGAVAFAKHKGMLEDEYGEVLYVSLLSDAASKRETEGALTMALKEQLRLDEGAQIMHLDFHAKVTGDDGIFDRELEKLASGLVPHVQRFGFFDSSSGGRQCGVVRTSCFDCLDRTNILQYQLVWRWLSQYCNEREELRRLVARAERRPTAAAGGTGGFETFLRGALNDIMPLEEVSYSPLQVQLRSMWADLGDALSEQYTGTASTMGAALRQGGHTPLTLLEKGWRSVNRAYCARFGDEARQAALELLLGKHRLLRAPTGPPEARRAPCGQLSVAVVTWNLHGRALWEVPGVLSALLAGACAPGAQRAADVVVFCFQEFVELTATNVVMQDAGDETRQVEFEAAALKALPETLGESFVKVRSVGMVGLYVGAFVAERLLSRVSGVSGDRVRAGLYRKAGNKGAVAVRFEVAKTSVCALSLHLESGAGKATERTAQLREVLQNCFTGHSKAALPPSKHDLAVLGGDFNFRLVVPQGVETSSWPTLFAGGWPALGPEREPGCVGEGVAASQPQEKRAMELFASYDELVGSHLGGTEVRDVLREEALMEGPVLFPPTYRLVEGARAYDTERAPAWCDRVLHSKVGVVRRRYCALGGLMYSDHRPVCALLETQLLALPGGSAASSPAKSQRSPVASPDLLGFETSSIGTQSTEVPASASTSLADTSLPQPTPSPTQAPPGREPRPGAVLLGQLVLAEYRGGWYYAHVLKVGNATCDIAWLRPQGVQWGSAAMSLYLCSTGADETLHGEDLPLATRIRIPDGAETNPPAATKSPASDLLGDAVAPAGLAAVAPAHGSSGVVDLLG